MLTAEVGDSPVDQSVTATDDVRVVDIEVRECPIKSLLDLGVLGCMNSC